MLKNIIDILIKQTKEYLINEDFDWRKRFARQNELFDDTHANLETGDIGYKKHHTHNPEEMSLQVELIPDTSKNQVVSILMLKGMLGEMLTEVHAKIASDREQKLRYGTITSAPKDYCIMISPEIDRSYLRRKDMKKVGFKQDRYLHSESQQRYDNGRVRYKKDMGNIRKSLSPPKNSILTALHELNQKESTRYNADELAGHAKDIASYATKDLGLNSKQISRASTMATIDEKISGLWYNQ